MEPFWVSDPPYFFFLETSTNYVLIIININSNITVLVSHNVIYFGYSMPES